MWGLWATLAVAGTRATLIDGAPEFGDCLGDPTCEAQFTSFLAGSMLEQAVTMRPGPLVLSAAIGAPAGVQVGGRLDTFPLGPPPSNLSGKEENTQFSPVLPRLVAGWVGETAGAHLGFLPGVPVGGASAWVVSGGATFGADVRGVRLGGEADLVFVYARAPIAATEQQLADRESFSNPDNLDPETYAARCGDAGCLDTFRLLEPSLRGVVAVAAGPFTPFGKLGATVVHERLDIAYDATSWRVLGVQPSLCVGSTVTAGRVGLALAGTLATNLANAAADRRPVAWRLEGEATWRFGG